MFSISKFYLITLHVVCFINLLCCSEIITPVWQQYFPQSHAWASISEIRSNRSPRVRVGQGRYRILPTGNAEITCDFPESMLLVSNIIWERADAGTQDLNLLYRRHGITHQYDVHQTTHGSTLHLFDVTPIDRGLYRCIATAMDPITARITTLFQDTEFFPDFSSL